MRFSIGKLAHVAAAGAMVLGIGAFDGLKVGPRSVDAREAQAIAGTYKSTIILANPGTVDTTALVTFVTSTGGAALSSPVSQVVPAGGSAQVVVPNVAGLANGRYSVLIDSDQPITAVANVGSDDTAQFTSYNGITTAETGQTFYIPQAYKSYVGYTSNIIVQNAGSSTASVTVTYKNADGSTATSDTQSIPAGASFTFDQAVTTGLPASWQGSAVVTANQNVAAMFLVSLDSATYGRQLSSGRGFKSGASAVYMPSVYNDYYGNSSSIMVQNLGSSATTVTVTYYRADGTQVAQTEQAAIAAGSKASFLQFDTPGRASAVPAGFNGSAVITASGGGQIAAVGNIQHLTRRRLESYNGFPAGTATNRVTCPSIFDGYYLNDTSLAVQNVGSSATTVTVSYSGVASSGRVTKQVQSTINPGAIYFAYTGAGFLGAGFNGSAVITAPTGAQIVGVVNQETIPNPGDVLLTYDCTNS